MTRTTPKKGCLHVTSMRSKTETMDKRKPDVLNNFLTRVRDAFSLLIIRSDTRPDKIVSRQNAMYGMHDKPPFYYKTIK